MKRIAYTIPLEDFKTRYPLTYPSINDGDMSYMHVGDPSFNGNANYNMIPLGVNESICGPYSGFTKEMGDRYEGKTIAYCTLKGWYIGFVKYNLLIYSNECHGPYSNAVEYYHSMGGSILGKEEYEEMDRLFTEHGGDGFYRWLSRYYFVSLDFIDEYLSMKGEGVELQANEKEWIACINSLPNSIIYYPDACRMYGRMSRLKESHDCCDSNEYRKNGGDTMLSVLGHWIENLKNSVDRINSVVSKEKKSLIPCISLNVPLGRKVEDFGNLVPFAKKFVPGKTYTKGEVCIYDNDIYILKSGNGFVKDEQTGAIEFSDLDWERYYDYYKSSHPDEFCEHDNIEQLSGRTTSSLDSFERTKLTFDNLGNALGGYFKPSLNSKFTQPVENTLLDLKYELGKANNTVKIGEKDGITYYSGDVLYTVNLYYKDYEGNTITNSIIPCFEGHTVVSRLKLCLTNLKDNSFVDVPCADFIYYKNCIYYVDNETSKIKLYEVNGNPVGLKCVDHCTLEERTSSYWLSSDENYPIRYYEVIKDVETVHSDDTGMDVSVEMCDWYLYPSSYDTENTVMSPSIRKDELIGYSMPETVENNIYIDRGYATALDKHLRFGEVNSLESMEKYGNGTFKLINLEEETL